MSDQRLYARATVNLPGLAAGRNAYVNPDVPYVRACLDARYLIPLDEPSDQEETEDATDTDLEA